jgi:hypothetical protein
MIFFRIVLVTMVHQVVSFSLRFINERLDRERVHKLKIQNNCTLLSTVHLQPVVLRQYEKIC